MVGPRWMKRAQRHAFFLFGCLGILVCLLSVGWAFSQSPHTAMHLRGWLTHHGLALFLWRVAVYVTVLSLLHYVVVYRSSRSETFSNGALKKRLLGYRTGIVVMALVYELLVVTNVIPSVIGMVWQGGAGV